MEFKHLVEWRIEENKNIQQQWKQKKKKGWRENGNGDNWREKDDKVPGVI